MASGTRWDRGRGRTTRMAGVPRMTGDDILRDAAETYALLPRSGAAAREAFLTLLVGYWPGASEGTRTAVSDMLRRSRHVSADVLDTLDMLGGLPRDGALPPTGTLMDAEPEADLVPTVISRRAPVTHRAGLRVSASVSGHVGPAIAHRTPHRRVAVDAPPLEGPSVEEPVAPSPLADAADHARRVMAQLARADVPAAPEIQPERIARELEAATEPAPTLARLLDIAPARAAAMMAVPRARGTAVALRALNVAPDLAETLVARWRGRAPGGFGSTYTALPVEDCLATVAGWRREDEGARRDEGNQSGADGARRSA